MWQHRFGKHHGLGFKSTPVNTNFVIVTIITTWLNLGNNGGHGWKDSHSLWVGNKLHVQLPEHEHQNDFSFKAAASSPFLISKLMLIAHCQSAQLTWDTTSTRGTWVILMLLFSSLNKQVDWQAGLPKNPHLFFCLRLPAVPAPLSTSVPPSSINYANLCTNTYHQKQVSGRWRGETRHQRKQTKAKLESGWI